MLYGELVVTLPLALTAAHAALVELLLVAV